MAQQVKSVVVDIGGTYIKAGFSGESSPRCLIPSDLEANFYGRTQLSVNTWINILGPILYDLITNKLLYRTSDSTPRIIICEQLIVSDAFRDAVAHIVFKRLKISGLAFVNPSICSMHISGSLTGLYVDIGLREIRIIAVVDGCPIANTLVIQPIGVLSILIEIDRLNISSPTSSASSNLMNRKRCEDILARTCYVRSKFDKTIPKDMILCSCPGFELKVPGYVQCRAADVLFSQSEEISAPFPPFQEKHFSNHNSDGRKVIDCFQQKSCSFDDEGDGGLGMMVLESISKCDINLRRNIISNVLVVGGGAMIPGLKYRLIEEIKSLVGIQEEQSPTAPNDKRFHYLKAGIEKYLKIPEFSFQGNVATWVGASIFSQLSYSHPFTLTTNDCFKHEKDRIDPYSEFIKFHKNSKLFPKTEKNIQMDMNQLENNTKSNIRKPISKPMSNKWSLDLFGNWVSEEKKTTKQDDKQNTYAVAGIGVV